MVSIKLFNFFLFGIAKTIFKINLNNIYFLLNQGILMLLILIATSAVNY